MKAILYLGLDPSHCQTNRRLIHCPLIQIVPRSPHEPDIQSALRHIDEYTHLLITSKSAFKILLDILPLFTIPQAVLHRMELLAVGSATASTMIKRGFSPALTAKEESSEGLIAEVLPHLPATTHLFWPHSSLSRPLIRDFLMEKEYKFSECLLYDTLPKEPPHDIDLRDVEEIIFTSPSTVEAFLRFFGPLPKDKILTPIGAVTKEALIGDLSTSVHECP